MEKDKEYYRQLYELERKQRLTLVKRLSESEEKVRELEISLNRIKGSKIWKLSAPVRGVIHWVIRMRDRILRLGNPKGVLRKLRQKLREKRAAKYHGKASFPTPEQVSRMREHKFKDPVTFSILVPLYNTPKNFFTEMVDSVINQVYENWELCLADGSDGAHSSVGEWALDYAAKDSRIKYKKLSSNKGISGNTNACYEMSTGSYIVPFDHDDILHPSVLYEYMKVIEEQGADYIYCDEATFHNGDIDKMITLHFKPDYAIDNLRANNYICHLSAFSRELLEGEAELYRTAFDGSQDHDMILRLTTRAKNVVHVPKLLYYWRSHKASVASDISAKLYAIDSAKGAVLDHLKHEGYEGCEIESTRAFETIFRIRYPLTGEPMVSILIPNKDHREDLFRCITSIIDKSTYNNYEIIVIENNSVTDDIKIYYGELQENPKITVVTYPPEISEKEGFNYSSINNYGASFAKGDYLLLLNNDTEVITPDWIEEMLMYGQREDVGAVGAKLYYPDNTIQHAGIVLGLGAHRTAGHSHYRVNYENVGYMGRLCYAQDVSAVTGACLLVRASLFKKLGGLSAELAIALNDVDFCLRIREEGFLIVFTPFAELFHYESVSRGSDIDKKEAEKARRYNGESAVFKDKWKSVLEKGDPYYNPNFSLDHSDFSLKVW